MSSETSVGYIQLCFVEYNEFACDWLVGLNTLLFLALDKSGQSIVSATLLGIIKLLDQQIYICTHFMLIYKIEGFTDLTTVK